MTKETQNKECCKNCNPHFQMVHNHTGIPEMYKTNCSNLDCSCHVGNFLLSQNKECCEKCLGIIRDAFGQRTDVYCKNPDCECHAPKNKPQEQEWEIEFEKEFCDENHPDWIIGAQRAWPIKSFIRSLIQIQKAKALDQFLLDKVIDKNGAVCRKCGQLVPDSEPQEQEEWEYGSLTFDEVRNIMEVCSAKDVKIKQDYLTISFVPDNATGKAWRELKERMLLIGKELLENRKSING
ncbi:MAG: hypothetical protein AABY22_35190 [Nanoarchaeota archaeon]